MKIVSVTVALYSNFHSQFPYFTADLCEIRQKSFHITLLGVYEFCENRHREGHTLVLGISELRLHVYRETVRHSDSLTEYPICRLVTNGVVSACVSDVW